MRLDIYACVNGEGLEPRLGSLYHNAHITVVEFGCTEDAVEVTIGPVSLNHVHVQGPCFSVQDRFQQGLRIKRDEH